MHQEWKKIAQSIVGDIHWESNVLGYAKCPGDDLHKHPTKDRHFRVTFDQVPTFYCFHSSCDGPVSDANHKLRSDIAKFEREQTETASTTPYQPSPEEIAAKKQRSDDQRLTAHAKASLPVILKKHELPLADLWELSPIRTLDDPARDWKLLLHLFDKDDVVWIGSKYSSCSDDKPESEKIRCRRFFRTRDEWLLEPCAPDQFTCPSTFQPGTFSRSNAQVLHRKYLVVESDIFSKDQMCSIINWARSFLHLRAVVDTAGKSLHGWFDFPPDDLLSQLRLILPNLGREGKTPTLDPALFKPPQPVRLPGALRNGKLQCLLYLDL